jgi:hypothetical protein
MNIFIHFVILGGFFFGDKEQFLSVSHMYSTLSLIGESEIKNLSLINSLAA